jgi:hypothetical protein
MRDTPFVLCVPTTARLAIRILRELPSSTRLIRATRLVARKTPANVVQQPPVDFIDDLKLARHQDFKPFLGHFSKASGNSV